jgi:tRNA (guanine37-N1)-methyltransferase
LPEAPCLKVPRTLGERTIRQISEFNLFDRELKVQQVDGYLCIPLVHEPSPTVLKELKESLKDFKITTYSFPERDKRFKKLLDVLADEIPPHLLASVPRAIDFIGDIAVVEVPPELAYHKKVIGEAILKSHRQTHTVLAKRGAVEGVYRTRDFEVIAGVEKTDTIHKEYGCAYHVDVAKAYFSPRLSSEHNRVASQVKEGEIVVDLFAGVGPFSIQIAKKHKDVKIYAIDVNPNAVAMLKKNVALNRVAEQVVPVLGDARQVIRNELIGVAVRVIMNLPETAIKYVDVTCDAIGAKGGIIHYYEFTKHVEPLETASVRLTEAVNRNNRQVKKILLAKTVREVAPYTWQVVIDAEIQ